MKKYVSIDEVIGLVHKPLIYLISAPTEKYFLACSVQTDQGWITVFDEGSGGGK